MKDTWDGRIQRVQQLAVERTESNELLKFHGALLSAQRDIYEYLRTRKNWLPSGEIERDLQILLPMLPNLLRAVEAIGPELIASQAAALMQASENESEQMMIDYRSEEHTSELQSLRHLVCRLLLEKKK